MQLAQQQLEAEIKSTVGEGRDWLLRVFLHKKIQKPEGETRAAARMVEGPSLWVASHTLLVMWLTSQHQEFIYINSTASDSTTFRLRVSHTFQVEGVTQKEERTQLEVRRRNET